MDEQLDQDNGASVFNWMLNPQPVKPLELPGQVHRIADDE